jgi:hypothetical protein
MIRRALPHLEERGRSRVAASPLGPGEHLTELLGADELPHPLPEGRSVARVVGEEVVGDHVLGMGVGRTGQPRVGPQGAELVGGAEAIDEADHPLLVAIDPSLPRAGAGWRRTDDEHEAARGQGEQRNPSASTHN